MSAPPRAGPKSIEEIVKDAQNFDHKTTYPLRIALRTAQSMLNQAVTYERDGNFEAAYLFFYRHAEFYFAQIAKHVDAKTPEFKPAVARVRDEVNLDITKLETLKPELQKRYDRYQEALSKREAARASLPEKGSRLDGAGDTAVPRLPHHARLLNAGQHNDLALRLANRELRRRDTTKQDHDGVMDDLTHGIRAIGRQLDEPRRRRNEETTQQPLRFNYPAVPHGHDSPSAASTPALLPTRPPKASFSNTSQAPDVPAKSLVGAYGATAAPALPSKEDLSSSSYTFQPSAFTEGGLPLRTLFLPEELRARFLDVASKNTRNNLETCGILCGSLISNAFFISRLIIPDQVSTSDTCEVTEEGDIALFDYVDGQNMTVCGWIHTHPSQTCFLSSRDLHTSVGYQVMLPESVAIVCAPSKTPDHGIFRLTDPSGKDVILSCHQPGLFHPHAQNDLYTDALRPGHVSELKGLQFELVDLRSHGSRK